MRKVQCTLMYNMHHTVYIINWMIFTEKWWKELTLKKLFALSSSIRLMMGETMYEPFIMCVSTQCQCELKGNFLPYIHPHIWYYWRVRRDPHGFCLGLALIELVLNTLRNWPDKRIFTKLKLCFRQVCQVQALNKQKTWGRLLHTTWL